MLKYNKDKPYQKYCNGIKNFRQIAFYNDEEENATDQKTSESSQSLGATKPTRYLLTNSEHDQRSNEFNSNAFRIKDKVSAQRPAI